MCLTPPHRSPRPHRGLNGVALAGLAVVTALAALAALAPPAGAQLGPILLRGPYLQSPTPTSIVVRWRTALPGDGRVRYGTAPDALDRTVTAGLAEVDHEVRLAGLEPATRYYYAVGSSLGDVAAGPDHTFVTPPLPGSRRPLRIWTFGDSGLGPLGDAGAVRDGYLGFTGERGTDVWVLLGDNAYVEATDPEYQLHFFDYYPEVLRQVPAWSTFGNHEGETSSSADQSGDYYEIFTFPTGGEVGGEPSGTEAYFSFDVANVHFINLNSHDVDRSPAGEMAAWLERDLAANAREWTIAFFHQPPYSFGSHPSDTERELREMRENIVPILEAGGVDLVLAGHSHNYERTVLLDGHYGTSNTLTAAMKLDPGDGRIGGDGAYRKTGDPFADAHSGTVYAVVGTGAEVGPSAGVHPAMAATAQVLGSLVVDVDGPRLDGRFVDRYGEVGDRFTILRGDNLPPTAGDDAATTAPATAVTIDVLANDADPDEDLLFIESVGAPALGTAVGNADDTVTYTPPADLAAGADAFTYTVSDGRGLTATATVTVTVACPPAVGGVFADDLEPGAEPGWTVVTARNDDPASPAWAVVADPAAHSPSRSWFSDASALASNKDDRLVSRPLALSSASRLSFWHRYRFESGFDGGVLEISENGGASWSDLGGSIVAGGYGGVEIAIDGRNRPAWTGASDLAMTPVEVDLGAFAGPGRLVRWRLIADLFTVDATLGWLVDDVEITALADQPGHCNLPPLARDDEATTTAGSPVAIDVLANDSDPDGDPLTVAAVSAPAHGTAAAGANGVVTYTPEAGFTGADAFSYEVTDGELSAAATVAVTVVADPSGLTRVRGNGEIADGVGGGGGGAGGRGRFALHATRDEGGGASGWLRYRTRDDDGDADSEGSGGAGGVDIDGWVRTLRFPAADRAELEGVCWFADGSPCTFRATAEDRAHPGAGADRFAIEIDAAGGATVHAAGGTVTKGQVKID